MGGFSGSVPEPTLARVRQPVASGQLRFFLLDGAGAGFGAGLDEKGAAWRRRSPAGWNPPAPRSPARTTELRQARPARRRSTYAAELTISPGGVASAGPL
jgi:hypothetical protein